MKLTPKRLFESWFSRVKTKTVPSGSLLAKRYLPFQEFLAEELDAVCSDTPSIPPLRAERALEKLQLHLPRELHLWLWTEKATLSPNSSHAWLR